MRLTESGLRRLVRSLLQEATTSDDLGPPPPPDEPDVAPDEAMGRYLMPMDRLDSRYHRDDLESDTELELDFRQALTFHYRSNDSRYLQKVWSQLVDLKNQGLYSDILTPPAGTAYRVMSLDADRAAQFLGVTPEEISSVPHGETKQAPNPPPFQPRARRGNIASWTMDPMSLAKSIGSDQFINTRDADVTILLVADTEAGEFLMDPYNLSQGWEIGKEFEEEEEVLSGGVVPLLTAAWMWHGDELGSKLNPPLVMRKLLDAIGL